jgi:hypothetical protein
VQLVSIDHAIHLAYNYTNLVEVIRNYGISLAGDASDILDCNKNKPGVQKKLVVSAYQRKSSLSERTPVPPREGVNMSS